MVDVLTTGESMGAVRADGMVRQGTTARLSVAGAESNVAIGLARMGHQARWAGVLGDDQLGALVQRTLRAEGVDTSAIRIDPAAPTGILVFEHRVAGLARVDYHRLGSAGSRLLPADLVEAMTPTPRILHLTGLTMALGDAAAETVRTGARTARERGATVCLDVNHRSRLCTAEEARTSLASVLGLLDVVIASEDELALIAPSGSATDAQAKSLLGSGVQQVVVKLGADGATAYSAEGEFHAPARAVTPVDTIGAGDAFVAGYLSALLDGLAVRERLERANTLGAFVVATAGDWEGLPTRAELSMLDHAPGEVVR